MKDGYKDTLFGKLPDKWNISKIKDITVEHKQGYFTKEPYVNDGTYLARVTDLKNPLVDFSDMPKLNISSKDYEDFKICKDDFLFARSGAIGRYGIFENDTKPAIFGSYIIRFRFDLELVVNRYIGYFYESSICRQQLKSISQGNANVNINAENIKSLSLPIPPLLEQQKIADILTTVDDKLENIESQIAEYTNLKKGLMQQLLTKGIGHSKFVDSKLGMIPEGWRVVKLGEIGSTYNGLSGKSKDDFGNGEPYIPYMNIFSNNTINPNWLEYVSISPDENQNAVKYGDVFFTTSSETPEEVGMSSVLLDDIGTVYLNSFCFGFRLNDFNALLPDYAKFLFRGQAVRKSIVVFAQGSTRFNLSKTNLLKRLHLALPPISEQKEIANILTSVDEKMKSLLQKKEEYTKLKKGLMEQLLTGRIRVKV